MLPGGRDLRLDWWDRWDTFILRRENAFHQIDTMEKSQRNLHQPGQDHRDEAP